MSDPGLLPCPFCGDKSPKFRGVKESGIFRWIVRCDYCQAQSTSRPNKVVVADDWNHRRRERDFIDTLKACVVAAGGHDDIDALERQMEHTKRPSDHLSRISWLESGLQRIADYWDEPTGMDSDELNEVIVQIARHTLMGKQPT